VWNGREEGGVENGTGWEREEGKGKGWKGKGREGTPSGSCLFWIKHWRWYVFSTVVPFCAFVCLSPRQLLNRLRSRREVCMAARYRQKQRQFIGGSGGPMLHAEASVYRHVENVYYI